MAVGVSKSMCVALASVLLALGQGGAARAEPAPTAPVEAPSAKTGAAAGPKTQDPDEGIAREAAEDLRTGHFLVSVGGVVAAPTGAVVPASDALGTASVGGGVRAMVGVGLSRYAVLRLDGGGSWITGPSLCDVCSAATYDVGLGFDYHLAQGIALDPWIGLGVGYRYGRSVVEDLTSSSGDRLSQSYAFDFARIAIGGDFFPLPLLGFGPFIETDIGARFSPDNAVYAVFFGGLRVTLDPMSAETDLAPTVARR